MTSQTIGLGCAAERYLASMMNEPRLFFAFWLAALGLLFPLVIFADDDPQAALNQQLSEELPERKLRVATHVAPPFVMKTAGGEWEGISIDLWKEMARELHLDYEFTDMDLANALLAVEKGRADIAVGPISMTALREAKLDFTHPYYQTGLSFGFDQTPTQGLSLFLGILFSWSFLITLLSLIAVWLLAGLVLWMFEQQPNEAQSGGSALWRYAEPKPATPLGRIVVLMRMFASVMIISIFIGTVAASLTTASLRADLTTPEHLKNSLVATLSGSSSQSYLEQNRIRSKAYQTLVDAIKAVETGEVQAILFDRPILQYYALQKEADFLTVLPQEFGREDYGFVLPQDSPRREELNQAMLHILNSEAWQNICFKYLGSE